MPSQARSTLRSPRALPPYPKFLDAIALDNLAAGHQGPGMRSRLCRGSCQRPKSAHCGAAGTVMRVPCAAAAWGYPLRRVRAYGWDGPPSPLGLWQSAVPVRATAHSRHCQVICIPIHRYCRPRLWLTREVGRAETVLPSRTRTVDPSFAPPSGHDSVIPHRHGAARLCKVPLPEEERPYTHPLGRTIQPARPITAIPFRMLTLP